MITDEGYDDGNVGDAGDRSLLDVGNTFAGLAGAAGQIIGAFRGNQHQLAQQAAQARTNEAQTNSRTNMLWIGVGLLVIALVVSIFLRRGK